MLLMHSADVFFLIVFFTNIFVSLFSLSKMFTFAQAGEQSAHSFKCLAISEFGSLVFTFLLCSVHHWKEKRKVGNN
uniref:Putative secreted protein n=1 Tax=Ixodes ricinus TaxID=34613 RepID=A0A6B0UBH6_IXORI